MSFHSIRNVADRGVLQVMRQELADQTVHIAYLETLYSKTNYGGLIQSGVSDMASRELAALEIKIIWHISDRLDRSRKPRFKVEAVGLGIGPEPSWLLTDLLQVWKRKNIFSFAEVITIERCH